MRGSGLVSKVPPNPKIMSHHELNQGRFVAQLDCILCHWTTAYLELKEPCFSTPICSQ